MHTTNYTSKKLKFQPIELTLDTVCLHNNLYNFLNVCLVLCINPPITN